MEELVEDIVNLLGDPEAVASSGQALKSELSHLDLHHQVSELLNLIRPDTTGHQITAPLTPDSV